MIEAFYRDHPIILGILIGAGAIGGRIQELRDKWSRIATHLFDAKGWNGRHERIARLIDPNLTMKLQIKAYRGAMRMGSIKFDREYLREEAA